MTEPSQGKASRLPAGRICPPTCFVTGDSLRHGRAHSFMCGCFCALSVEFNGLHGPQTLNICHLALHRGSLHSLQEDGRGARRHARRFKAKARPWPAPLHSLSGGHSGSRPHLAAREAGRAVLCLGVGSALGNRPNGNVLRVAGVRVCPSNATLPLEPQRSPRNVS